MLAPDVDLEPHVRQALAREWLADAQLEHSAIAACSRLSCDLLAVGARPELVEASCRAAVHALTSNTTRVA